MAKLQARLLLLTTLSAAGCGGAILQTSENTDPLTSNTWVSATTQLTGSRCLDVTGNVHDPATPLELWDCWGGPNQQFKFVSSTGEIKVYDDSTCLDASGATGVDGDPVIIWPCHGGTNQKWHYDAQTGEITGLNGKCLDVTGASPNAGAVVELWNCWGGANQRWTLGSSAPSPSPANGTCGSANGVASGSAPSASLCTAGTASAASGTGPWAWSCSGSNGGTSASCSAPVAQTLPPLNPNAFYVATSGNDAWSGTLSSPSSSSNDGPFQTLARAQQAMRASTSIKTTYVRAGTYYPASNPDTANNSCFWGQAVSLYLNASDSGETWSYFPPDGYNTAIIDGGAPYFPQTGPGGIGLGTGSGCAFGSEHAVNVTINGLQFQHYRLAAYFSYGSSDNTTFENNVVHDLRVAAFGAAAFSATCSPGSVVKNNYVYNVPYFGLAVGGNAATCPGALNNTLITGNVVLNSCSWPANPGPTFNDQDGGDCGAIYLQELQARGVPSSTNIRVTSNYIRDIDAPDQGAGDWSGGVADGIYLDQATSNVTISGNVITGIKSACAVIHGGYNNVFRGNLCDLSNNPYQQILVLSDTGDTPMSGNTFDHNIVVDGSSSPGQGFPGSSPSPLTLGNNAYFNYVGSSVATAGSNVSDPSPTYVNPQISCWAPVISSGSPVFGSQVNFPGIQGGWGPPGFIIPQNGTPPSWPHGC